MRKTVWHIPWERTIAPLIRFGRSFADTSHQSFGLLQPIAYQYKNGTNHFNPPDLLGIAFGRLLQLHPKPINIGKSGQCKRGLSKLTALRDMPTVSQAFKQGIYSSNK